MDIHRTAPACRAALLFSLMLAGCHRRPSSSAGAQPCGPLDAPLAGSPDTRLLTGSYDVTFAVTGGARTGHAVLGRLVLRPQDAALVRLPSADTVTLVSQPSVGTLDVATDSIGATRMCDLIAADPRQPGVGVYVSTRAGAVTSIVARIGSASNGRGVIAFDGGHFTLHVRRLDEGGIWGDWLSNPGPGGLVTADARGYFCAVKTPA